MEQRLWGSVIDLAPLQPAFVSVTYGAGGGTRSRTHITVERILKETPLVPAAHLTCVGASQAEVNEVAEHYWQAGVRHIVALRGDPPAAGGGYIAHPQGYAHACDLVAGLKRLHPFEVSVAAFPEKHPESPSFEQDMEMLKRKVDAGATRAITQYFFEANQYFQFVERVRSAGITIPIVPGILPITNFAQTLKFSRMCGASVPAWLGKIFAELDNDPEARHAAAINLAVDLCRQLESQGVDQLHFYTLNRSELVLDICHALGVAQRQRVLTA